MARSIISCRFCARAYAARLATAKGLSMAKPTVGRRVLAPVTGVVA